MWYRNSWPNGHRGQPLRAQHARVRHPGRQFNPEDSIRTIHKGLDTGINLVDTADAYGDSEEVVGRALKGGRDNVVLAMKVSRTTQPPRSSVGQSSAASGKNRAAVLVGKRMEM